MTKINTNAYSLYSPFTALRMPSSRYTLSEEESWVEWTTCNEWVNSGCAGLRVLPI